MESLPLSLVVEFWRAAYTLKNGIAQRRMMTAAILLATLPALIGAVGSSRLFAVQQDSRLPS
jgi:hypothetical protein